MKSSWLLALISTGRLKPNGLLHCVLKLSRMKHRDEAFLVGEVAIVVVVLALVMVPSNSYVVTESSYASSTGIVRPFVFVSPILPNGLQLRLVLSATTMNLGGEITGQVIVVNTSDQNVTVPVLPGSQNITAWSNYINVCPSDYFLGYAVFPGHLTSGNISSAGTPLEIVPSDTGTICPPPQTPIQITFLPGKVQTRANETFYGIPLVSSLVPDRLNVSTTFSNVEESEYSMICGCPTPGLVGYWNPRDMGSGALGTPQTGFVPFAPGEYTVVAWDDWNQYAYATFMVLRSSVASGPVGFHRTDGNWSFTVSLSSLVMPRGQPIVAYVNLTNISGQTQTINEDDPLVNPAIHSENGSMIWVWNPSKIYRQANVTAGEQLVSGSYYISTSKLTVGQNYTLSIWPLIEPGTSTGPFALGESLIINATISVTQG